MLSTLEKIEAILDVDNFACLLPVACRESNQVFKICKEDLACLIFKNQSHKLSKSECLLLAEDGFSISDFSKLIKSYINDLLCIKEGGIFVRFSKWVEWKKSIVRNGQDMFLACFISENPINDDFKWPMWLSSDCDSLNTQISGGYADNHYHLSGSGPIFLYNWWHLQKQNFDSFLRILDSRAPKVVSRSNRIKQHLPLIKKYAFFGSYFRRVLQYACKDRRCHIEGWNDFAVFWAENDLLPENIGNYERRISSIPIGNDENALPFNVFIASERNLLIECFRNFEQWSARLQASFLAYLIAKRFLSSFFVQNNGLYGLDNFNDYCFTKDLFVPKKGNEGSFILESETMKNAFSDDALKTLEIRVTTSLKNKETRKYIFDLKRHFEESEEIAINDERRIEFIISLTKPNLSGHGLEPVFSFTDYVSFVRRALFVPDSERNFPPLIAGFDCSGDELNCNPAFFAPIYCLIRSQNSNLGLTYHVGEDFLSLSQGIRSVYEAIFFLNLGKGDRIGHACSLGVDPDRYFALKGKTISETAQEALDDFCFFSFVYKERRNTDSMNYWKRRAQPLLNELYLTDDVDLYMKSIPFRGVGKAFWKTTFESCEDIIDHFKNANQAFIAPEHLNLLRMWSVGVAKLAKCYAADEPNEKKTSRKSVYRFEKDDAYLTAIKEAQEYVLDLISERQIVIESNPTSNYLIGPFSDFEDIPIFSFLEYKKKPISISIGTDDAGLFSVDLRGEYTSVYYSLQSDEDGLSKIERLRENSLRASFPKSKSP